MKLDIKDLKKQYTDNGFFVIKKFLNVDVNTLLTEILSADDVDLYNDKYSRPRRIERIYDKSKILSNLYCNLANLLEDIFEESMVIFKDKYNSKPPGGEGFYAHYDGVFLWKDHNNSEKKGWYEYTDCFFNVLVALDDSNQSNGTIEIAKIDNLSFNELLKNTMQNGTPELTKSAEAIRVFNPIDMEVGDIVVFSHKYPHRSAENKSTKERRLLYYTFNKLKDGCFYHKYFSDKKTSNPGSVISKALSK
jgi:2-aminoethylphosphonate dioxygenase